MCELFGMSCNTADRANISLSHLAPYSEESCDGWGIAYYKNGKGILKREPKKARKSPGFFEFADRAKSNIIIAHIRQATHGTVCEENCHPFIRNFLSRDWIFAHNGTIDDIDHHHCSLGETDSEQAFNHIIDKIDEYTSADGLKGMYPGIKKGIQFIFDRYDRDSIRFNFLMSDGTLLYAFNHYPRKPMFYLKRPKTYGSAFLISTQKLGNDNWKKLKPDQLLVLLNGEVLLRSDTL
jgi:predicted glutamine amidotransferase